MIFGPFACDSFGTLDVAIGYLFRFWKAWLRFWATHQTFSSRASPNKA